MRYTIVREFPEATRRKLTVGDVFVPSNDASAQALMQAGMLRAGAGRETLSLKKALDAAPRNKDAAPLRRNK